MFVFLYVKYFPSPTKICFTFYRHLVAWRQPLKYLTKANINLSSTIWSLGYSLIAWFIFSLSINTNIAIKIFSDFTISTLIMFSSVKYCRPHILRSHKQMAHFSVLVDFNIIKFLVRTLWRVHCPNSLDHIKKYDVVVKTPK